jgi:hypothetical protein
MNTTIIDHCDIAAYRRWTTRRVAPAYVRGLPSWVWESALCQSPRRSGTVT